MKFDKLRQRWEKDRIRRQKDSEMRREMLKKKAIPVFKKYNISKAVLFGSSVENRIRSDSDIDLFVRPLPASVYWEFVRELEETIGLPVDMVTDSDDEVFVKKILERGEVLYEI